MGIDSEALIRAVGYVGIFGVIFAETGLLVGFFLPGDSLLITAGLLASRDVLNLWLLLPLIVIAAVAGNTLGYLLGHHLGRGVVERGRAHERHGPRLARAEALFQRHGGPTVIIARFVPVARTFVPLVAGIGAMGFPRFMLYNLIGAALWVVGLVLAGYFVGNVIPHLETYLAPATIALAAVPITVLLIRLKPWRHGRR